MLLYEAVAVCEREYCRTTVYPLLYRTHRADPLSDQATDRSIYLDRANLKL